MKEICKRKKTNWIFRYRARQFYENNHELRQALDQIKNGYFSPENPELFHDIFNSLLGDNGDQYVDIHSKLKKHFFHMCFF
jgi:glucan phosphorylase